MSPEARQVLLGMKERLAAGWIQGKLVDVSVKEFDENGANQRCLIGAASEVGLNRGDTHREDARPGYHFPSGGVRKGIYTTRLITDVNSPTGEAVEAIMAELGVERWDEVAAWNDVPGRTHEEVVAVIDRVLAASATPAPAEKETVTA